MPLQPLQPFPRHCSNATRRGTSKCSRLLASAGYGTLRPEVTASKTRAGRGCMGGWLGLCYQGAAAEDRAHAVGQRRVPSSPPGQARLWAHGGLPGTGPARGFGKPSREETTRREKPCPALPACLPFFIHC